MMMNRTALGTAAALSMLMAGNASAGAGFETSDGWSFDVNGYVPVFAIWSSPDASGNTRGTNNNFSITTGFNPATAQFNVAAPTSNGLDVSAHVQLNNHIGGGGITNQNGAFGTEDDFTGIESRVAKFVVSGGFGSLDIGKGFGIYGTPAIGDAGSAMGVGNFGGTAGGAATGGHIGTGYFYSNFNPRVIYTSNSINGLQFKIGAFNPTVPDSGFTADMPRFEGNVTFSTDVFQLWASGGYQSVEGLGANDDYDQTGVDFGGSVGVGGFSLRANYAVHTNTGGAVWGGTPTGLSGTQIDDTDYDQWYVEGTYDVGAATFGASYGEGEFDVDDPATNELLMVFTRYNVTDQWALIGEYQDKTVDDGTDSGDYDAFIVGSQFTF